MNDYKIDDKATDSNETNKTIAHNIDEWTELIHEIIDKTLNSELTEIQKLNESLRIADNIKRFTEVYSLVTKMIQWFDAEIPDPNLFSELGLLQALNIIINNIHNCQIPELISASLTLMSKIINEFPEVLTKLVEIQFLDSLIVILLFYWQAREEFRDIFVHKALELLNIFATRSHAFCKYILSLKTVEAIYNLIREILVVAVDGNLVKLKKIEIFKLSYDLIMNLEYYLSGEEIINVINLNDFIDLLWACLDNQQFTSIMIHYLKLFTRLNENARNLICSKNIYAEMWNLFINDRFTDENSFIDFFEILETALNDENLKNEVAKFVNPLPILNTIMQRLGMCGEEMSCIPPGILVLSLIFRYDIAFLPNINEIFDMCAAIIDAGNFNTKKSIASLVFVVSSKCDPSILVPHVDLIITAIQLDNFSDKGFINDALITLSKLLPFFADNETFREIAKDFIDDASDFEEYDAIVNSLLEQYFND